MAKYLQCNVFHPGKVELVTVDIEVRDSVYEDTENPLFEDVIISVINEFLANGLSVELDNGKTQLYNNYSQSDYVGTVEEIILRIHTEFG